MCYQKRPLINLKHSFKNNPFCRLDGGAHFYDTYKTKDGKYMAVGSLEPQFYQQLMKGLEMTSDENFIDQFADFKSGKEKIAKKFAERTQAEWTEIFDKLDACVTPVLEMDEAAKHEGSVFRNSFAKNPDTGHWDPEPAPKLSRTPATLKDSERRCPAIGEHSIEILEECGYDLKTIKSLISTGVVNVTDIKSKM